MCSPTTVQKDLNLLRQKSLIKFRANNLAFKRQIKKDVSFLKKMGLIDYSLLIAGEKLSENASLRFCLTKATSNSAEIRPTGFAAKGNE